MKLSHLAAAFALFAAPALALDDPKVKLVDPLNSGMWDYHQVELLGDPEVIAFDDRVRVLAPEFAEDSFHVPVLIDASAIPGVRRIVLFVDYGPIPKILTFWPEGAQAKLSFRFKIDQSTAVRAAVETADGAWHVGARVIDAAGGGCTAPAVAYAADDWEEHLGEVQGRVWPETSRARLIVDHPMDTGLADGIPVFIIEDLALTDESRAMGRIELHEPVNEDPAFTFYYAPGALAEALTVTGRDNNGNRINAVIRAHPRVQ